MQEKVSKITPPTKSTDNQIVLNLLKKSHTILPTHNIVNDANKSLKSATKIDQPITKNVLDQLALDVQNNMNMEITGKPDVLATTDFEDVQNNMNIEPDTLATTDFKIGDDWEVDDKENEILETAKEFLGVKYIWAANGPNAFDCSGYTKYVFKQNGITLPRYSGYQAKVGKTVKYNELKKGDLVFFDTEKHLTGKVNHVGIYIGNHKFIHASSAGKKVMITSFNKKRFYKNRFLHGQRVLKNQENFALLSNTTNNHI